MSGVVYATDRGVATITVDRPHVRNAISLETMDELEDALRQANADRASVLVLRGSGDRAFISGGDLKDLAGLRTFDQAARMAERMRDLLDQVAGLPMPTIAALNGHALGGGAETALACDMRIAAAGIKIGFNQSQLAIMPAWGGVERLVDLLGRTRALALMLTGRRVSADDAMGMGLVDQVVASDELDAAVADLAAGIAAVPVAVTRAIKATVDLHRPNRHRVTRDEAVANFARLWIADDHWDAVANLSGRKS